MAKFDKKPGSRRERPSGAPGGRKNKPAFQNAGEEERKKNNYKAKRSFTRNKSIREKKETSGDRPYRPFERNGEKPFKNKFKREGDRPFRDKPQGSFGNTENVSKSRFNREGGKPLSDKPDKPFGNRPKRNYGGDSEQGGKKQRFNKREAKRENFAGREEETVVKRVDYGDFEDGKAFSKAGPSRNDRFSDRKKPKKNPPPVKKTTSDDGLIRLNKYLSNAGIASRREADILIQSGTVKVNGVVVDQLGYKIKPGDKVSYGDATVKSERKVYLLLNKPKDYITTMDDPQERKTVMQLIEGACRERVYPVGRLDRNTTGLLLFTNDGELTTRLTHPKFGVKKIYHVSLNKGLKPDDFKAIVEGVELEDGPVKADDLAFVGEGKKEIGIEIHSGRNRIVRRLFEHLGYDVIKLDRVAFAGLTKKDLPRGKYRFLTAKEISFLHMVG